MVGAAAQSTTPKSNQNLPNQACTTWIPRLHPSNPDFHHYVMPCNHNRGAAAHSTSKKVTEQESKYVYKSENYDAYRDVFHDESCYQQIQMGGAHRASKKMQKTF